VSCTKKEISVSCSCQPVMKLNCILAVSLSLYNELVPFGFRLFVPVYKPPSSRVLSPFPSYEEKELLLVMGVSLKRPLIEICLGSSLTLLLGNNSESLMTTTTSNYV
jgi:hypothetical protein